MFALLVGIIIGIYLDQLLTIPPLNQYTDIVLKYIDETRFRKNSVTGTTQTVDKSKEL